MYIPYKSISKNPDCVSFIPENVAPAQELASQGLIQKYPNWDSYIQKTLNYCNKEELFSCLSAEQIDAVGFIVEQIKAKSGIILADETGVGKGRTLASVYRWCQLNKKKLLFFTYNKDLFSDLVRDLNDIGVEDLSQLHVMHNSVTVYNKAEEIVFKSSATKNKKRITEADISGIDLLMTTYSQINSRAAKSKVEFLMKYAKDCIIILDESHNAAGESNTRKNIEKIIGECDACVYASATFLKNEDEFSLYKKAIDSLDAKELDYLRLALEDENCEKLRSHFTLELIKKGKLIRREHEPLRTKWEHLNVDITAHLDILDTTSGIFNSLFEVIESTSENEMVYSSLKNSWFLAGSHINRVFKNIILLLKIDALMVHIEHDLKNNLKPVVIMESTFASILKNLIADNFESDLGLDSDDEWLGEAGAQYHLSFKNYIAWIVDKILQKNIPPFGMSTEIYEKIEDLNLKIKNFDDSFATLSPIDRIKTKIKEIGYSCVEISGRDFEVLETKVVGTPLRTSSEAGTDIESESAQSLVEIRKIKKQSKTLLVNQFNSGEADIAILTRSGSTGFSLHNAPHFKDKRTRSLYELEISNRPQVRVQFVGRVRRKGQLSEPLFRTLVTNLPFEARLIEQQQNKMRIMHSHISTDSDRLIGENIIDLYSESANTLAKQFLISYPTLAMKMGINLNVKYEPLYFIDMILKRCVILSHSQNQKMFDYLLKGLEVASQSTETMNYAECRIQEIKAFVNDMTPDQKDSFRIKYQQNKLFAINSQDYNWSCLAKLEHTVKVHNHSREQLELSFAATPDLDGLGREKLTKFLIHQINSNYVSAYNKECYRAAISQMAKLKKGSYVSFDSSWGRIFGYIHSITAAQSAYLLSYPTHYLVEINILNSKFLPKNSLISDKVVLDLNSIFLSPHFKLRDNARVEFEKFESVEQSVSQEFWAIMGNPIFVSYLQKIYSIGYMDYLSIDREQVLALVISREIDTQTILNFRKPIFDLKKTMDYLLYEKKPIYVSPSEKYEGNIIVVPTTGGVHLEVQSNYNDKKVFDFAMNKALGTYTYKKGIKSYFINHKAVIKTLAMLKKRGINFFI